MSTEDPSTTTPSTPEISDRGKEVAGHARSEVEETASHAAERAQDLAGAARTEVRDVVDEARDAIRRQADEQAKAAAGALAGLRDDLRAMSDGEAPRDAIAGYLQRAAGELDGVVGRLEREGIEGALSGIRRFARRRPGGFLVASAGAGFAVGRLVRNADHPQQVTEDQSHDGQPDGDEEIDLTSPSATTVEDSRYDAESNRIFADGGPRP